MAIVTYKTSGYAAYTEICLPNNQQLRLAVNVPNEIPDAQARLIDTNIAGLSVTFSDGSVPGETPETVIGQVLQTANYTKMQDEARAESDARVAAEALARDSARKRPTKGVPLPVEIEEPEGF